MDGSEGGLRCMSNYAANQGYGSTRPEVSSRNIAQPHSHLIADNYVDEDDQVEEDEEEDGVGDGGMNCSGQQSGGYADNDDGDDDDEDNDDGGEGYKRSDGFNLHKHPKKRKLKSLLSSFELVPRVPPTPPAAKPGGRNTLTDWSEDETFVLLDAWGERFLQRGRKSIRSEEWKEVAEKVAQVSKVDRTDTQCRNRLDTLKKKYKKEKALLENNKTATTKWVYFKTMDMLMGTKPPQQAGLSCGVDSGELVFMNPNEMRDSPGNTDSQDGGDDFDLLPPKRSKYKVEKVNSGSFKLLADSINKFCETYEKIEVGKRKLMVELEKMKMDFHKDLELQKRQILERARDEIAKIRQENYKENDSAGDVRG